MRRGLGRGRLLIGIGAVMALVAMVPPWFTVGGQALPERSANGFEGAGIVVFIACIALLAVLALPYASRTGSSGLDRPLVFILLAGVGLAGYGLRVLQLWSDGLLGMFDRAPGLWLAGAGLLIVAWGVAEVLAEPAPLP